MGGAVRPVTQPRRTPGLGLRSTFATNIALAVLAAVTGVFSARLLHPAGEGELAAIQTWPFLLGTLAMLGLTRRSSTSSHVSQKEPDSLRRQPFSSGSYLPWQWVPSLGLYCLSFSARQPPQVVSAARVFLLIGGIYAVVGIPHGSLRGAQSFTAWNLFRVAPGLAWLCMLFTSWLLGHPNAIPLSRWYLGGKSSSAAFPSSLSLTGN